MGKRLVAFDTETNGLSTFHGARPFLDIWTESDDLEDVKLSFRGNPTPYQRKILKKYNVSINSTELKEIMEDENIVKIAHNLKFDLHMMRAVGIELKGTTYDTMAMCHLINENIPKSLAFCSKLYLKQDKLGSTINDWFKERKKKCRKAITKVKKRDKKREIESKLQESLRQYLEVLDKKDYSIVPLEIMIPYAGVDAWLCRNLFTYLYPYIKENGLLDRLEVESKLCSVLLDAETRGVKVNVEYFKEQEKLAKDEIDRLEKELYNTAGKEFNTNSGQQIAEILTERGVKLPVGEPSKKTGKVSPKTDAETLKIIYDDVARLILLYREQYKFYSTYFLGTLEKNVDDTIHCSLNNLGTTTGRFSCSNPNLQNLHKEDKRVRKGFITREGYTDYYIDYKQMEYRVFADYCRDNFMVTEIQNGADFHQIVVDALGFVEKFNGDEGKARKAAKTLNFALLYGMGDEALAKKLEVSLKEAKEYRKNYFGRFTSVEPFMERAKKKIEERGYIYNRFGRRRRLNKNESYKAVNALIQGCCGDMVKNVMIKVWEYLKDKESNLTLMIHDELKIEVKKGEEFVIEKIKKIMEDWNDMFIVPIEVDVEYTDTNWSEKKKVA